MKIEHEPFRFSFRQLCYAVAVYSDRDELSAPIPCRPSLYTDVDTIATFQIEWYSAVFDRRTSPHTFSLALTSGGRGAPKSAGGGGGCRAAGPPPKPRKTEI
jgi:hypothetical protein